MTEATNENNAAVTSEAKPFPTGVALTNIIKRLTQQRAAAVVAIARVDAELPGLEAAAELEGASTAQRNAIEVEGLAAGTPVVAIVGRGDKRRDVDGVVRAFAPQDGKRPATYAVEVGAGIDVDVVKVAAVNVNLPTEEAQA